MITSVSVVVPLPALHGVRESGLEVDQADSSWADGDGNHLRAHRRALGRDPVRHIGPGGATDMRTW
jgi:hypothetical protein